MLPMPFSPSTSWPAYKAKFMYLFRGADPYIVSAFWFFGKDFHIATNNLYLTTEMTDTIYRSDQ